MNELQQERLNNLNQRLLESYSRVVYPASMGDMPIELEKMAIIDETGAVIGHYSINSLAQALGGKTLVPVKFNQQGTLMHIRWSFNKSNSNADEQAMRILLSEYLLVDMAASIEAEDIIINELAENVYGLFDVYEFKQIPKEIIPEEPEVIE